MASALEWLTGVLFDEEQHSSWTAASGDERAQILKDAGLEDLDAQDMSEAMQLLAEELPPEQAAAISEATSDSIASDTSGMSALDHFVSRIEPIEPSDGSDEFDVDPSTQDEFETLSETLEIETESDIDPDADFDSPSDDLQSEAPEEFLADEDPMDLDDFDRSATSVSNGDAIEEAVSDLPEELDLGNDPGDF